MNASDRQAERLCRTLGEVFTDESVNLRLVRDGMAWHYVKYSDSKELADAEKAAREAKAGLWDDPATIPPWEFRAKKKQPAPVAGEHYEHFKQRPAQLDVQVFSQDEATPALWAG